MGRALLKKSLVTRSQISCQQMHSMPLIITCVTLCSTCYCSCGSIHIYIYTSTQPLWIIVTCYVERVFLFCDSSWFRAPFVRQVKSISFQYNFVMTKDLEKDQTYIRGTAWQQGTLLSVYMSIHITVNKVKKGHCATCIQVNIYYKPFFVFYFKMSRSWYTYFEVWHA